MENKSEFNLLLERLNDIKAVAFDLTSVDGDAFRLMSAFSNSAHRQGWSRSDIKITTTECMSGDYDHLVQTLMAVTIEELSDDDDDDDEGSDGINPYNTTY